MRLIFILLLLPSALLSQTQADIDSLDKYSYRIVGYSRLTGQEGGGSCFFLRSRGQLFLVTAKHVITGCKQSADDFYDHPIFLNVWLTKDSTAKIFSFDISPFRDSSVCPPIASSPDIAVLKVNDTKGVNVYSVENLIAPPFAKLKNSLIIGYPYSSLISRRMHYIKPSYISLPDKSYWVATRVVDSSSKTFDSINYWINLKKPTTIQYGAALGGYSGSPFFAQDLSSDRWRIAGLMSASSLDPEDPYIITVKFDEIINMVNQYFIPRESK